MTKPKNTYIVFTLFILCSCTSTSPYPKNWPALNNAPPHNCSEFEGTYKNYNGDKYLSNLFGIKNVALNKEQHIELTSLKENSLEIILTKDNKDVTKHEITTEKDEYICDDGAIHLQSKRDYYAHQMVLATSRAEITLHSAEDQSIIAEIKHKSFTLALLLLPIASNKIVWSKWEKHD